VDKVRGKLNKKMRIPISYPSENGKNVWVILDFQGVIETADGVPDGIPIGRIEFKSNVSKTSNPSSLVSSYYIKLLSQCNDFK
jgi:hypothetical protein